MGMMNSTEFSHRKLPVIGKRVLRMGLAPNYGISSDGVDWALGEGGMQYVFFTPRMKTAIDPLRRALKRDRDRYVVATGPTTAWWSGGIRRFVDRTRAMLEINKLDVLQVFWVGKTSRWTPAIAAELEALRDEGAVRAIGVSIHDRKRAAELARTTSLDLLMIRYNAAHPGAEVDIFPNLPDGRHTVVSYTATCWRRLLKRPKDWEGEMPTAADCYRFCLSSPQVDVVLTGPKTVGQLRENLAALERGPFDEEKMAWMKAFGSRVEGRGFNWL
jgi:aryl-alcohol dehydrogenase-like predicted oxidoreductase